MPIKRLNVYPALLHDQCTMCGERARYTVSAAANAHNWILLCQLCAQQLRFGITMTDRKLERMK